MTHHTGNQTNSGQPQEINGQSNHELSVFLDCKDLVTLHDYSYFHLIIIFWSREVETNLEVLDPSLFLGFIQTRPPTCLLFTLLKGTLIQSGD